MKVYILIWGHYDTCRHRAVYATREAAEAQAAKDQATMVWAALAAKGGPGLPTENAKLALAKCPVKKSVSFVRFYGGRRRSMDFDGVASACKPVLDALKLDDKGVGLIFDDRPEWCCVMYSQEKDKAKAGQLRVTVQ